MDQPPCTPRYWFPAKRYGWGWGLPVTWQGWAVFVVYWAVLALLPFNPWWHTQPFACLVGLFVLVASLVAVCWLKGEPPRWRWGK